MRNRVSPWLLLFPLLLGAGGQSEPRRERHPRDPLGNICLMGDLVAVGRFVATRFHPNYQGIGVPMTEADLLVEYVLASRDLGHHPGGVVTYLTLGGRHPSGGVSESSLLNFPDVGDWFFIASFQEEDRVHPTIVAYRKLPDLSQVRVDEASLQGAYADLCARHPEGIYQSDFLKPDMRGELQRVMGRLSP